MVQGCIKSRLLTLCVAIVISLAGAPGIAAAAEAVGATAKPDAGLLTPGELARLRKGGFNIFFRHGLTPNYADPDDQSLNDCSTQRNLSREGIDQMRAVGEAFRDLEIPVGEVRASPMCRTMDTAWHAFGRSERDAALKMSGSSPDNNLAEAKTWRHLRNIAEIVPLAGTNSVFISHGTVGDVFGAGYLDEGEAVIIEPDGAGGWSLFRRVKSREWRE